MNDRTCAFCQHWRKGKREKHGVWEENVPTEFENAVIGICCIRSTPGTFPTRFADDYCHEYKRIESKHPGYVQTRVGIAE